MGNQRGSNPTGSGPARSGGRTPLIAGVLLILVALGVGGYWWMSDRDSATVRGVKPAIPRVPRPATLSPVLFTGYAAQGYQVAKEIPEVLEHVMCYCGCDRNPGHQNNLDCFADEHGSGWDICVDIALEAQRLHKQGLQVVEIKNRIDRAFARWAARRVRGRGRGRASAKVSGGTQQSVTPQPVAREEIMPKQVVVYTQPGWGSCDQEKEFLSQKGIDFVAKNIREDPAALQELLKLGFRATPVTIIDGEAVVGFDRGRLERLLGPA